jgi:hypothetical protein
VRSHTETAGRDLRRGPRHVFEVGDEHALDSSGGQFLGEGYAAHDVTDAEHRAGIAAEDDPRHPASSGFCSM